MRSIKVLPESVRSCMRSGIIVFDLTRVVEELVFNSLDAGAVKVIVAVGVGTSYIKVTDNGCGVTRDGLVLLGERYATSKFEQLTGLNTIPESFGFRGEALSSIADVSLLEVATKAHGMPNGYRKVIKGCKCLHLGIDDDRHDVGTTVVVRDLFYNQPVKRRHLQSSPKKVLHSVKESILRIALVHLGTCFKLIDNESGDELLSIYPSSSPLPLLKSCFGIEVTHSLHKLYESDGELKLSGYMSGPDETFSVKAFQYFYINSRYISRGPIHKLLNQLATMQSCSDLLKADVVSECGKRSRSQASPTYILNLTCPRAHYDLSFEPAKTYVEFKDWDPVFTFVKKSVSRVWSQDMSGEDDIWKRADTLLTKDDHLNDYGLSKKRCMERCNQDIFDLSAPQLEMSRLEPKHMPFSRYSCNQSQKHTVQPEDYGYISSKDTFLETNEQMDLLSDSKWDLNNSIAVKKPSPVSFHFNDDGHIISDDLMKPFLRRCSSRIDVSPIVKSTIGDNQFFDDDGINISDDRMKPFLRHCSSRMDVLPIVKSPKGDNHFFYDDGHNVSDDRMNPFPRHCSSRMDVSPIVNDDGHYVSDDRMKPFLRHCSSRMDVSPIVKSLKGDNLLFDDDGHNISDDRMKPLLRRCSSRMVSPIVKCTKIDNQFRFQADRFRKWLDIDERVDNKEADYICQGSEPLLDATATVWSPPRIPATCKLGTDSYLLSKGSFDSVLTGEECLTEDNNRWASPVASFRCDWSPSRVGSPFGEKRHAEPVTDVVSKRHFKHRREDDLFEYEEKDADIFKFESTRHSSSLEDNRTNIRHSQNDSILLQQKCDFLNETDWEHSESLGEHETCIPVAASRHLSSISNADGEKSVTNQHRYQDKQRRRSCSAPPLYKGKKKFVDLNCLMTVNSGKSHRETFHNATTVQEASHHKHIQKPSGVDFANDLRSKARHDKKKHIDNAEVSDCEGDAGHCRDVCNTSSDVSLKENQGALDLGVKWRNGCPSNSSTKKTSNIQNQESILDISSDKLDPSGADSLLPKSVSKKCLEACRVLQQVDKKFIPIVGGGILAIIDQHAADERIRLEDLREKVLSGETKTTYLDAEKELVLPEIGYQLLNNYSEHIQKWGWICNFHAQSSVSFKKNLNFLHNQPSVATLIAVPCILGVSLTDVDLLEFLQQLSDTDGSSVIPPAVLRVLNFKACRGAIMFGDALLPSECSVILEELKQTSMCFQCAHGRPTTVPLVNLVVLHKQIAKLGNRSHGSSEQWHGLSRHKPSLERATERLSQC